MVSVGASRPDGNKYQHWRQHIPRVLVSEDEGGWTKMEGLNVNEKRFKTYILKFTVKITVKITQD